MDKHEHIDVLSNEYIQELKNETGEVFGDLDGDHRVSFEEVVSDVEGEIGSMLSKYPTVKAYVKEVHNLSMHDIVKSKNSVASFGKVRGNLNIMRNNIMSAEEADRIIQEAINAPL